MKTTYLWEFNLLPNRCTVFIVWRDLCTIPGQKQIYTYLATLGATLHQSQSSTRYVHNQKKSQLYTYVTYKSRPLHFHVLWFLCNIKYMVVLLLCGDLRNYENIKTAVVGEKLACWTEGFRTADLDFDLDMYKFGTSASLVFCIVAGWFFSTATI